jgi:hypothetical protein
MAEVSATLPLELERKIFEVAALFRPVTIPAMMRVAWRVKLWRGELLPGNTFHSFHRLWQA